MTGTGTQTQTWTTGVTTIALLVLRTGELKTLIIKYGIYANIFAELMRVAFAFAKATHIFSAKIPVN